jgi:hypothetical protein
MNKLTIKDLDVQGKRVLMRVDFNVPVKDGVVGDDTRIVAALPSINYVLENGGSLVLMSHCGRPKGEKNMEFTLKPAADRLAELVDAKVTLAPDVIGAEVKTLVDGLQSGEILVLENVRFYAEEEGKKCTAEEQDAFAKELASFPMPSVLRIAPTPPWPLLPNISTSALPASCFPRKLNISAKRSKLRKSRSWPSLAAPRFPERSTWSPT